MKEFYCNDRQCTFKLFYKGVLISGCIFDHVVLNINVYLPDIWGILCNISLSLYVHMEIDV